MNQGLKEVHNLTVTLLAKEYSSDNLESIFKVKLPPYVALNCLLSDQ